MNTVDFSVDTYESTEITGISLALGPTMTVGRSTTTSTILTCTCGDLPDLPDVLKAE